MNFHYFRLRILRVVDIIKHINVYKIDYRSSVLLLNTNT